MNFNNNMLCELKIPKHAAVLMTSLTERFVHSCIENSNRLEF